MGEMNRNISRAMKKTILRNSKGEEVAAIFVDEKSSRWRIVSKAEPTFKRTFATEKEAFDVWHANFNAQTGKLRKYSGAVFSR